MRVAVIGAGHLGRIHARILAGMEGVTLAGVADPVETNRREVAAAYETAACADHRELIGRIDAAIVATPTRYHHHVARDLLSAGIHVLVEKPLAASTSQGSELVELARQHALVLQVGHVERFNPAFAAAQPYLREPKYIEAVRRSGFSFRSTDIGVVLDLMVHDLDLVLSVVRSPLRRVDALGVALFGKHEDVVNARLTFENGCVAALSASRASHSAARTLHAWSSRGMAAIDLAARSVEVVRPSAAVLRGEVDVECMTRDEQERLKQSLLAEHLPREPLAVEAEDPLSCELADFVTCIRTGRAPRVTGQAGLDALQAAERILLQVETHAWEGSPTGPVGPRIAAAPQILRGPHWHLKPSDQEQKAPSPLRRAG
ncbi:MAG TPA: Gfo/Idh/MocA family oxidoreductase [Pirellulales bacterium]|nr:Gfo/Idh/MocA family oxidoreductase [Pirellulales bacterium]